MLYRIAFVTIEISDVVYGRKSSLNQGLLLSFNDAAGKDL